MLNAGRRPVAAAGAVYGGARCASRSPARAGRRDRRRHPGPADRPHRPRRGRPDRHRHRRHRRGRRMATWGSYPRSVGAAASRAATRPAVLGHARRRHQGWSTATGDPVTRSARRSTPSTRWPPLPRCKDGQHRWPGHRPLGVALPRVHQHEAGRLIFTPAGGRGRRRQGHRRPAPGGQERALMAVRAEARRSYFSASPPGASTSTAGRHPGRPRPTRGPTSTGPAAPPGRAPRASRLRSCSGTRSSTCAG